MRITMSKWPGLVLAMALAALAGCGDDDSGGGDAGADADADTDADADSDTDADGDCPGVDDSILGGSCLDGAGIVCNEWSVDESETQYDQMVEGWQSTCVNQGGTWATAHCDTANAVGICEDDTVAKVITVYYEASGLTAAEIEATCSEACQVFSVP
jgi:hypothetical protein